MHEYDNLSFYAYTEYVTLQLRKSGYNGVTRQVSKAYAYNIKIHFALTNHAQGLDDYFARIDDDELRTQYRALNDHDIKNIIKTLKNNA